MIAITSSCGNASTPPGSELAFIPTNDQPPSGEFPMEICRNVIGLADSSSLRDSVEAAQNVKAGPLRIKKVDEMEPCSAPTGGAAAAWE